MDQDTGSSDSNSVLAAANRDTKHQDQSANQVLNAANQRLQSDGSGHSWLWAILLVGGALAGVFGVKRWADNNVPNAPINAPKKGDTW